VKSTGVSIIPGLGIIFVGVGFIPPSCHVKFMKGSDLDLEEVGFHLQHLLYGAVLKASFFSPRGLGEEMRVR
jgi:hypothetical protein